MVAGLAWRWWRAALTVGGAAWLADATAWAQKPGPAEAAKAHKVAIQVSQSDKAQMDLALNNAENIATRPRVSPF
jgi:hypothetical protein